MFFLFFLLNILILLINGKVKCNEGWKYHVIESGAIYSCIGGKMRWIPNPHTYNKLFNQPWRYHNIYAGTFHNYYIGVPLPNGASLVRGDGDAAVYLTDIHNGYPVKRWICSPYWFNKYDFNWHAIRVIPKIIVDYSWPTSGILCGYSYP
mmetsp:Transcript_7338/g.9122  ORF Transcript_7338/g.9122 Transcript_7338/m.9122 type:complete len:150 (-) Transcript_7338:148-597(-)